MLARRYTTAAAKSATTGSITTPANIRAGLILSRVPIITPELTPFEEAYYNYQDELERRLMWTFPAYYYFKRGSLKERQFMAAQRGPAARQPDVWFPRGLPDIQHNRERRDKQEVIIPKQASSSDGLFGAKAESEDSLGRPIVPNPRKTEADAKNDLRSLSRALDRTLYLVTKSSTNANEWKMPSFSLEEKEPLHAAVERGLREIGGQNLNTWTVSNTPAGVFRYDPSSSTSELISRENANESTVREFFIKSHILHGKFVPQTKDFDYMWLTKQEISEHVSKEYFEVVAPILSEQ